MLREIKALTVRQPWANLIASGEKTIEVRTWRTDYRGELLITASASPKIEPFGCALVIVDLVDVRPMTPDDFGAAHFNAGASVERKFAWVIENPRLISRPKKMRGRLGLWNARVPESWTRRV